MTVFDHIEFHNHEQVLFCNDPSVGLKAIIAIHSTSLGPAAGGCRMFPYQNTEQALTDVLRLSRGMSHKNAMGGLPLGGGKSVIIADPSAPGKQKLLKAFTRFVQNLGGEYWTAIDIGTTQEDASFMHQHCDYVFALIDPSKNRHDPSWFTSLGGLVSIKAVVEHQFKTDNLKGIKIAIQGCGKTGAYLCELLHKEGAELLVSDVRESAMNVMVEKYGAIPVAPEDIYSVDADVFAPCAMGAILNEVTIDQLKFSAIAGLANNQLATLKDGERLGEKGILYAPDYIANAGGMLYASEDIFDSNEQERSIKRIHGLKDTLLNVFKEAELTGKSTQEIADEMAENIIHSGKRKTEDLSPV
ncbi:MAG: Glu/Leu/Phe/Val dehydrogenase dimerization domain-containing protein [Bacteroidota bacterium]